MVIVNVLWCLNLYFVVVCIERHCPSNLREADDNRFSPCKREVVSVLHQGEGVQLYITDHLAVPSNLL